jgi:hypothetical protein
MVAHIFRPKPVGMEGIMEFYKWMHDALDHLISVWNDLFSNELKKVDKINIR